MGAAEVRTWRRDLLMLAVLAPLAACGGGSHPAAQPDAPAAAPSGSVAQVVSYRCAHGRRATISISLSDPRRLADVLNPINVCEYDGGLAEIETRIACDAGRAPTDVRVVAVNGKLPASTARTLCGP